MKNLLKTLTLIGLSLSLSVNAQTSSGKVKSQADVPTSSARSDAKSAYITSQDYLSVNSTQGYQNVFGDSLKGFDETKVKSDLLAKGLGGQERQIHVLHLKREFINTKYGIGKPSTSSGVIANPNSTGGGKPIGGINQVNIAPCVNEDFEGTPVGGYTTGNAVTGWSITSRTADGNCNPTNWTSGSPHFSIVSTPILSWGSAAVIGAIPNSPLGGSRVAQLNNHVSGDYVVTRITQTFPVTNANTLFQFAYAGYWQDGGAGHACCPISGDQPAFNIRMFDCLGAPLSCSNLSLAPGLGCQSSGVTYTPIPNVAQWTNWQVKYIDLTPYIGTCVTIELVQADCAFGGHWGSTLFDSKCGGQLIGTGLSGPGGSIAGPVSFCAGSGQAQISAPVGYATYNWVAPSGAPAIPANQATLSTITITNPIPGSVYTVNLVAPSGCVFTSTNAITVSTVNIAGIGSSSTCPGGASGSGTVIGNGSGSGYNYTWTNATNSVVGTSSVVTNLGPGVYNITITGVGAAGCGSAASSITVSTAPPGITPHLKPFCNNEAYLGTSGGSNFHWYNGMTPIPAPFGTNPTYTVTSPVSGSVYWLSYLSNQGCQDSLQFTLVASTPGIMSIPQPGMICPGGNNGKAVINIAPAAGAPPGLNSYSVWAIGTTPPYTSTLFPTSANNYTALNMQAGTYSVNAFDGSCKYGGSFMITPLIFNYNVTPQSVTLCPGNTIPAAVTFTNFVPPGQYTFSWSPSTYVFGTNTQNALITPVLPIGSQTTIIYTVVVTPTLVNCPMAKTFTLTAINPQIPTINPILNFCDIHQPVQIVTNPPGGTFISGISGTNNPISPTSGIITPSLAAAVNAPNGVNTFTYSTAISTCVVTQTGTFQVSKFRSSALTSNVPPQCVTNPQFNLMNIVQNSGGSWSGAGVIGGGTSFSPGSLNGPMVPTYSVYSISYNITSIPNPAVCPHSTTLSVAVTKTTVPTILSQAEFCTNSTQMTLAVSPAGGGWINNPAVSNSGVINPPNASVPTSIATYTVLDGPCLNTATTTLKCNTFHTAGFSGGVPALCYNSNPFNLFSIVQSTVGVWGSPMSLGGAVSQNSFNTGGVPTGVYTLTYTTHSTPNAMPACADSRTINVSVLNPLPPTITQVGPFCSNGNDIQLVASPNDGYWTTTSYLTNTGLFTPGMAVVGNNPIQYVVGTNTCNVQQTKFINVEAFIPAAVSSKIPDQCNTSPVINLSPFTITNLGVWSGPGITGTSFNPGTTGSGNFVIVHKTASSPSGLCPDQATVAVSVYSLAAPVVTQAGPFCNSTLPVQLTVTPVGGLFGGADMGIVSFGGKFNPAAALIGNNVVNYSITSGPCVAYAQTIIKVEKFISANFSKEVGPFCKTDLPVNLYDYVQNDGGTWTPVKGLLGNVFNPSEALPGTLILKYSTNSQTGLCPSEATVRVEVREIPKAQAIANFPEGCAPFEVSFNTPITNVTTGGQGTWNFGDGSEFVKSLNTSHVFTTPGTYTVTFSYVDDIGCKAIPVQAAPVTIIHDAPKVDFSVPEEIYISDPQVQFTNLSTVLNDNTYQWKIGSMTPSDKVHPTVSLDKIGKYQVTLIATSAHSCTNEVTKTIEVKNNFNVFIPNSFSPNFDGLNDIFIPVFSPYGLDAKSFEMEIFDRWGHSIYHTKDTNKGWDGSIQNKGEPLKEEVYIYRIKYKDLDGNSFNKMGHLSLVK